MAVLTEPTTGYMKIQTDEIINKLLKYTKHDARIICIWKSEKEYTKYILSLILFGSNGIIAGFISFAEYGDCFLENNDWKYPFSFNLYYERRNVT